VKHAGGYLIKTGAIKVNRDKKLLILDAALTSLLDNFMYQPEDFADLDFTEADIRDMIVNLFHVQMRERVQ
jgi:hypothetical protein